MAFALSWAAPTSMLLHLIMFYLCLCQAPAPTWEFASLESWSDNVPSKRTSRLLPGSCTFLIVSDDGQGHDDDGHDHDDDYHDNLQRAHRLLHVPPAVAEGRMEEKGTSFTIIAITIIFLLVIINIIAFTIIVIDIIIIRLSFHCQKKTGRRHRIAKHWSQN